ncbi:tissue inhibitor of metalloproteinase-like [Daphnia pulex]|uniref:tissue inhibitor of metalloproteinase-like n=1 Tax=Daphnia pulex TaxID=6669 RepID=UPI001EE01DEB|nr:tissue inhibitor of metalloproteinase-like [Daphnia pulex]XP_046642239.1 tissue inhibitor of metalloproteinase-like [Daphnia pulicaria]
MKCCWALLSALVILTAMATFADGCSCSKRHPQEHYCSADFVVLAHVKRIVHDRSEWSRAYKVRIKKEFKVTESGRQALSYGRILTPSHDASCGIRLKPGRRYLLTGNIRSGKPWINLCNFVHDWDRMTPIQRKGFRRLYQRGCDCKVMECHWWGKCPSTTQACTWDTAFDWHDCQSMHAICTRGNGGGGSGTCRWSHSKSYRQCSKKRAGADPKNPDDPARSAPASAVATSSSRRWKNNLLLKS